jgi:hypothetical protein
LSREDGDGDLAAVVEVDSATIARKTTTSTSTAVVAVVYLEVKRTTDIGVRGLEGRRFWRVREYPYIDARGRIFCLLVGLGRGG